MTKLLLGAATAALLIAMPGVAQAQRTPPATIVVVDTERLQNECTACRAAGTQIQAMVAQGNQRAQQLAQPLQAEQQSLEQAAQTVSNQAPGAARTAAEASIRQRAQALQARQAAANQELQRLDQNIQSTKANVGRQLAERLNPIYSQVMNAHGANLLVEMGATLAHAPTLDVTNEVLAALNAAAPSVSVTPLPAPPPGTQPQGR
jgi:Skp family chaperone for outer membrane proteins